VPVQKFCQVLNEIPESELPTQGKAIVFAAELIADHAKMISQNPR